jgi:hypothetical protein
VDLWDRLSLGKPELVDQHTVSLLTNVHGGMSTEMIRSWFWSRENERSIFSGMTDEQKKQSLRQVLNHRDQRVNIDSLKTLFANSRTTFLRFYEIAEQIPVWFDIDAARGYQGGTSIANRPRVEQTLVNLFGRPGYAAIMIHLLVFWKEMHDVGQGIKCDEHLYIQRFQYRPWHQLGYTLFYKWRSDPIYEVYRMAVKDIKQYKVPSPNSHLTPQNYPRRIELELFKTLAKRIANSKELGLKLEVSRDMAKGLAIRTVEFVRAELEEITRELEWVRRMLPRAYR